MEKDKRKLIVRTVFHNTEIDGVNFLLTHKYLSKPQDLFKLLVANEVKDIKTIDVKYGSKRASRETDGPQKPTPEEVTAKLMLIPEETIVYALAKIGFTEDLPIYYKFEAGDMDMDIQRGKRYFVRHENLRGDGHLADQMYEKGDELNKAVIEFIKKTPASIDKLKEMGII